MAAPESTMTQADLDAAWKSLVSSLGLTLIEQPDAHDVPCEDSVPFRPLLTPPYTRRSSDGKTWVERPASDYTDRLRQEVEDRWGKLDGRTLVVVQAPQLKGPGAVVAHFGIPRAPSEDSSS